MAWGDWLSPPKWQRPTAADDPRDRLAVARIRSIEAARGMRGAGVGDIGALAMRQGWISPRRRSMLKERAWSAMEPGMRARWEEEDRAAQLEGAQRRFERAQSRWGARRGALGMGLGMAGLIPGPWGTAAQAAQIGWGLGEGGGWL